MLGSPELFCHAESPSQGAWLGLRLRPCPSSAVFLLGHGGRAGQHSHAPTSLPPLGRFVAPAGWLSPTGPVLTHGHPLPCWPHPHSTRSPHVSVTWECDAGAAPSPTFLAILMCPQGGESRVASAKRFASIHSSPTAGEFSSHFTYGATETWRDEAARLGSSVPGLRNPWSLLQWPLEKAVDQWGKCPARAPRATSGPLSQDTFLSYSQILAD